MAKEILAIPEENIPEVIRILKFGLESDFYDDNLDISEECREALNIWINEMEEHYASNV